MFNYLFDSKLSNSLVPGVTRRLTGFQLGFMFMCVFGNGDEHLIAAT